MTRQKKELLKKIEEMEIWIDIDTELGCGFAPPDAYDRMYEEIYSLREELAHLRHYKTVEEMYYDERGQATVEEILQQPARNQKPRRNNSREMGR